MLIMKNRTKKGFLIVEALISITILVMVTVTGISLLILGQRAINYNEHSLEASLLAQEAANSLRGLRDTNWLRFGYDKATCWKVIGDDCTTGTPIAVDSYRLDLQSSGPPLLTAYPPLDISDGIDPEDEVYLLYYQDIDPDLFVIERFVAHDIHDIEDKASPFYRTIEVTASTADHIEAVCRVQWLESGQFKEISFPLSLTNYLLET
jgi:type II secretory pathway pseudopilin PulG